MAIVNTNISPLLKEGTNVTLTQDGQVITINSTGGGSGNPGGSNTQVQFNDSGAFGGDAGLTYDKTNNILDLESIDFATTPTATDATGRLHWDDGEGSLVLTLKGGNLTIPIGQEVTTLVYNAEATTLNKGEVVYAFGSSGQRVSVKRAINTGDSTSAQTLGVVAESIASGAEGFVMVQGMVRGINTSAYTQGDAIYLGATAGTFTKTKPYAPNHLVYVGFVVKINASSGEIFVKAQNGYEMDELHNVSAQSPSNNDILAYNTSTNLWEKKQLSAITGITGSGTNNEIAYFNSTGTTISSLSTATYPSLTELSYVKGVTSSIQTQLNSKLSSAVTTLSFGTTGLTPNTATSGAITVAGTLVAANGGTGQSSYSIGDILYASASNALSKLTAVAAGSYLRSAGTGTAPVWSTVTIPNAAAIGDIWYGSAANVVSSLGGNTLASKRFLIQTGNGTISAAPSWGQVTAADVASGAALTKTDDTNVTLTLGGTPASALLTAASLTLGWTGQLAITRGGTGASTKAGAFDALSPMTTIGDVIYGGTSGTGTRLSGNTTTAKQYLSQTGTGTASAAPVWASIAGADVTGAALTKTDDTNVTLTLGGTPSTSLLRAASITVGWTGTLAVGRGGTGASTLTGVLVGNGTSAVTAVTGTANQLLRRNAGDTAYEFFTPSYLTAAITSLNGLTTASQTFSNDTNVTITSATSTHTIGWSGQLSVGRGGTGASTLTGVLIGNGTSAVTAITGTAGQLLRRNAANTAYEFFTFSGAVGGSGAAGKVAYWTDANTLSSNTDFSWDNTNGRLGIGTASPTNDLQIGSTSVGTFSGLGIGSGSANIDIRIGQSTTNNLVVAWKYNATAANAYGLIETFGGSNPLILQSTGGNVGIRTTPSNWITSFVALDIGTGGSLIGTTSSNQTALLSNAYYDGSWRRKNTGTAGWLNLSSNSFSIDTAATGSAGQSISWNNVLTVVDNRFALRNTTPSNWDSSFASFDVGLTGGIISPINTQGLIFVMNAYADVVNSWRYKSASEASIFQMNSSGSFVWLSAASGLSGNAVSFTTRMTLKSNGQLQLHNYTSSTSFTGTIAGYLGFDVNGNIITASNGGIAGSGAAGKVAFWTDASTLSSNTDFSWDNTNGRLGIGTATPTHPITVSGSSPRITVKGTTLNANIGIRFDGKNGNGEDRAGGYYFQPQTGSVSYVGLTADDATYQLIARADGNVGIGTTSPSYKLQIRNDVAASTSLEPISLGLYNNLDGGAAIYFSNAVSGQSKISFGVESTGAGTDDTYLAFSTGQNAALNERMRINSSGNLGLGVTPSAWNSAIKSLEVSRIGSSFYGVSSNGQIGICNNIVYNTSALDVYANNGFAAQYNILDGNHYWKVAASGTAGGTITWNQAMTLDSSGRLGIGTTSPAATLHAESANVINGLFRNTGASSYTSVRIYNDQNSPSRALEIDYSGSTYSGSLITSGPTGESASITTTGNYPLSLGTNNTARINITNGGVVDLPFGQLKFPAAQNASSDANTLDDYEEGTWTPSLSGTAAVFNYATNGRIGTYTKIGRTVIVQFRIELATTGNTLNTNAVTITGLPFTSLNSTFVNYNIPLWWGNSATSMINLQGRLPANATFMDVYHTTAAATSFTLSGSNILSATAGSFIVGTLSYIV